VDASLATWIALALAVVALLLADLVVYGRGRREITLRESAAWSVAWIAIAIAFGAGLWALAGAQAGSEFFAGYLLERSLSVDNIFVFAVIFGYFAVPTIVQPRVLGFGIALALVLRLVFILIGAALLEQFHATMYVFGALLVYTAWKLARHSDTQVEPEHNPALRLIRRRVPMTAEYHGRRVWIRREGRRVATPLLAVLVVVATTDVVFAIDSIPAIFAITTDPFIVFAANAFALLGLRALYFTLVGLMDRFVYLSYGLAAVLAFVGAKMLLVDVWRPPIWLSLAVIAGVLAATAALSLRAPARPAAPAEPAEAAEPEGEPERDAERPVETARS
jgi:tellurite resistance protein TerC